MQVELRVRSCIRRLDPGQVCGAAPARTAQCWNAVTAAQLLTNHAIMYTRMNVRVGCYTPGETRSRYPKGPSSESARASGH
jgi:hypothetical protein